MKIKQATIKVYNIHKTHWKNILLSLITNFLYAFGGNAIPTFISMGNDAGVFLSQSFFYAFLVALFSRAKYETRIGKFYFWLALVSGGFSGYKFAPIIYQYIIT